MITENLHRFKIASIDDRGRILSFLQQYWNAEHIYLKSDRLFDYDYLFNGNYNFILAINQQDEIDGILGFILYSPEYRGSDIFTVLWKVKPRSGDPMLGMTLLTNLVNEFGFRIVSTVGANPKTLPLYEFLGYQTGQLKHYVILNKHLSTYSIVKPSEDARSAGSPTLSGSRRLISYETYDALSADFNPERYKNNIPYKSPWYISKRYFNHPFYTYKVFGIGDANGAVNSIVVSREIVLGTAKVLRIMDFIGERSDLSGVGQALEEYLHQHAYEYIDFYQYGIGHDTMTQAGFLLKDEYKDLIVPNYFEPFQQSNVTINFFTTAQEQFCFFKGDGDQDRPNTLPTPAE